MSRVCSSQDSHVSLITLNDPENGNRLNVRILESLVTAFDEARRDKETRTILFRARGDAFCLGMDLGGWKDDGIPDAADDAIRLYSNLLWDMFTCPKPVLCLVSGQVKAGGMGLLCASDIVMSTDQSSFELGEVLFGLIPANVLPYLLALRVPVQKARYLTLTAKRLSADEAHGLGLVDEVFPTDSAEKGVRTILRGLLRASPDALAELKAFTVTFLEDTFGESREKARTKLLQLIGHPRFRQAISAFEEGRLPDWCLRYRPQESVHKGVPPKEE